MQSLWLIDWAISVIATTEIKKNIEKPFDEVGVLSVL